jgi:hypothetical protein
LRIIALAFFALALFALVAAPAVAESSDVLIRWTDADNAPARGVLGYQILRGAADGEWDSSRTVDVVGPTPDAEGVYSQVVAFDVSLLPTKFAVLTYNAFAKSEPSNVRTGSTPSSPTTLSPIRVVVTVEVSGVE